MSNQAKRLSDCAAERLAQCRGGVVPPADLQPEVLAVVAQTDSIFPETQLDHRDAIELAPVGTELIDRAHYTRLQAEMSALHQRLNIADQRASDLTWLAKSAYMEGWELGWVTRHTDANNEKRVTPWAPPRETMEREWLSSEARAALNQATPAAKREEPSCLLCMDRKTIPGPNAGDFVRDCPDCCGEEG
jgi:hypothetical protein